MSNVFIKAHQHGAPELFVNDSVVCNLYEDNWLASWLASLSDTVCASSAAQFIKEKLYWIYRTNREITTGQTQIFFRDMKKTFGRDGASRPDRPPSLL
uniref:Uncharacterized protein n=1 Tax=Ditylenchus dipsaci TaxID=166011 RepID=A0A915CSN7_9BILA